MYSKEFIKKTLLPDYDSREKSYLKKLNENPMFIDRIISSIKEINLHRSRDLFVLNEIHNESKLGLSQAAMIYEFLSLEYKTEEFYSHWHIALLSLSDQENITKRIFPFIDVKDTEDYKGFHSIRMCLIKIIQGDFDALKHYRNKLVNFNGAMHRMIHLTAYQHIFDGFIQQNGSMLEKGINLLEEPKYKKELILQNNSEKYISVFSTAYAKQAIKHGINIKVSSPLVPKELLSVNPIPENVIRYRFLRDFYRSQGVDWKYDPKYPELQDWENDPENKNQK